MTTLLFALMLVFAVYLKAGVFGLVFLTSVYVLFFVVIPFLAKRDLRKIQIEKADLNNQEILNAIEKDLREKRKK